MLALLLFGLVQLCRGQGTGAGAGEVVYLINFDSPIYAVGDSVKNVNTDDIFVERYNETTAYMSGHMNFLKELPTDLILEILLRKEASGKFENLFSHDICDFCGELGKPDGEYAKYLDYFGIPSECPIEPGSYAIHDFTIDTSDMDIQSQHCGKYEAELNIYKKTGDNCKSDRELVVKLKIDIIIEAS